MWDEEVPDLTVTGGVSSPPKYETWLRIEDLQICGQRMIVLRGTVIESRVADT